MVVEEIINETEVLHYSDRKLMIRQIETGELYCSAIDFYPCPFTYEETEIPIEEVT